jgi:hypothetical protein
MVEDYIGVAIFCGLGIWFTFFPHHAIGISSRIATKARSWSMTNYFRAQPQQQSASAARVIGLICMFAALTIFLRP